jgi:hypothetical protein
MRANKILLRRVELDYAPKSQPRVPTRTCQGHEVTTDLPTLGTSPKKILSGSTTQEAKDLVNLQWSGGPSAQRGRTIRRARRTVRKHRADHPKMAPESLVAHREKRIVRALPVDCPPRTDCPHSPHGLSAKHLAPENGSKHELARTREEHDEHLICRLLADRSRPPGGLSAMHRQNCPNSTSTRSTPPSLHSISRINQGIATKS